MGVFQFSQLQHRAVGASAAHTIRGSVSSNLVAHWAGSLSITVHDTHFCGHGLPHFSGPDHGMDRLGVLLSCKLIYVAHMHTTWGGGGRGGEGSGGKLSYVCDVDTAQCVTGQSSDKTMPHLLGKRKVLVRKWGFTLGGRY